MGPAASRAGAAPSHAGGVGSFPRQCPGQPGGVSVEKTFNYTAPGVFPVAEGRLHTLYVCRVPLVLFDNELAINNNFA